MGRRDDALSVLVALSRTRDPKVDIVIYQFGALRSVGVVHLGKIAEVQTIGFQTPQKHYENQSQICIHFLGGTPLVSSQSGERGEGGGGEEGWLANFALFRCDLDVAFSCLLKGIRIWGRVGEEGG